MWKVVFILLCLTTVLLSFKRGGILCLFSGIFIYTAICVIQGNDWREKRKRVFLAVISIFFVIFATQ